MAEDDMQPVWDGVTYLQGGIQQSVVTLPPGHERLEIPQHTQLKSVTETEVSQILVQQMSKQVITSINKHIYYITNISLKMPYRECLIENILSRMPYRECLIENTLSRMPYREYLTCCCVYPLPSPLFVGGVRSSRFWSISQLISPSGQQLHHSSWVCPQIKG